ncbi:MAG: diguanylate cyclase, partial [Dehalococcoidales bacterium]
MGRKDVLEHVAERKEEPSIVNLSKIFITSDSDIHVTFEKFVGELCKYFDISWSAITLSFNNDLYFLLLSYKICSAWQSGDRVSIKGTGTEWVVTHQMSVVEPDILHESSFVTREKYLGQKVRSVAYLPLITENKAIGSLIVASCKPNAYNQKDTAILEQLACQITPPIKHSRLYAEVREKTRADELTGLLNRRALEEMISIEINKHSHYGGIFSLVVLGFDFLKATNNNYGYHIGDEIIRSIGITTKSILRNTDQLFRYSSDELAIILPNTSADAAHKVSERLQKLITSTTTFRNNPVTVSIGLAIWPTDGITENQIIGAADKVFRSAKRANGNQIRHIPKVKSLSNYRLVSPADSRGDELFTSVYALAATVDARNYYNRSHWRKVKEFVTAIAKAVPLKPEHLERLQVCTLLHDIGKIVISAKLINKRGRLTADEWEIIKSHPQVGANILSNYPQLTFCIPGVLYHH